MRRPCGVSTLFLATRIPQTGGSIEWVCCCIYNSWRFNRGLGNDENDHVHLKEACIGPRPDRWRPPVASGAGGGNGPDETRGARDRRGGCGYLCCVRSLKFYLVSLHA